MAKLHDRYDSSKCWQCSSYERGLDEPVPPPDDEKRLCITVGYKKSAKSLICARGNRDKERWRIAEEKLLKAANDTSEPVLPNSKRPRKGKPDQPSLDTFSEAVQLCVKYCNPKQLFYISMAKTRLAEGTIDDLVDKGFIRKYARKPSGYIYRLAGPYHYLVPKE